MKVWNYIMIMTTMIIFLNFVGLPPVGTDNLFNETSISINSTSTTNPINVDFQNSDLFQSILIALAAGAGAAIIVGMFTRQFEWKLVVLTPMLAIAALFISTSWSIVQLAASTGESWLIMVIATIFVPMMVGFGISVMEWFAGGND